MAHNILSSEDISHMWNIMKYLDGATIYSPYSLAVLRNFASKCAYNSGYHHESFPNNVSFTSQ